MDFLPLCFGHESSVQNVAAVIAEAGKPLVTAEVRHICGCRFLYLWLLP
uniref:Uncharacterized protein n=1 Tax=Arundo donax TaxID=35708 RepID=A0A0A8ZMQ7_ARUDO